LDKISRLKKNTSGEYSGPGFKTSPSSAGDAGLIPSQGGKIPQALWPRNQNRKQKECCNKFNKNLKMVHIKKKKSLKKKPHQAPLSLGFSRQEHWSGLPFPSPMHESEK